MNNSAFDSNNYDVRGAFQANFVEEVRKKGESSVIVRLSEELVDGEYRLTLDPSIQDLNQLPLTNSSFMFRVKLPEPPPERRTKVIDPVVVGPDEDQPVSSEADEEASDDLVQAMAEPSARTKRITEQVVERVNSTRERTSDFSLTERLQERELDRALFALFQSVETAATGSLIDQFLRELREFGEWEPLGDGARQSSELENFVPVVRGALGRFIFERRRSLQTAWTDLAQLQLRLAVEGDHQLVDQLSKEFSQDVVFQESLQDSDASFPETFAELEPEQKLIVVLGGLCLGQLERPHHLAHILAAKAWEVVGEEASVDSFAGWWTQLNGEAAKEDLTNALLDVYRKKFPSQSEDFELLLRINRAWRNPSTDETPTVASMASTFSVSEERIERILDHLRRQRDSDSSILETLSLSGFIKIIERDYNGAAPASPRPLVRLLGRMANEQLLQQLQGIRMGNEKEFTPLLGLERWHALARPVQAARRDRENRLGELLALPPEAPSSVTHISAELRRWWNLQSTDRSSSSDEETVPATLARRVGDFRNWLKTRRSSRDGIMGEVVGDSPQSVAEALPERLVSQIASAFFEAAKDPVATALVAFSDSKSARVLVSRASEGVDGPRRLSPGERVAVLTPEEAAIRSARAVRRLRDKILRERLQWDVANAGTLGPQVSEEAAAGLAIDERFRRDEDTPVGRLRVMLMEKALSPAILSLLNEDLTAAIENKSPLSDEQVEEAYWRLRTFDRYQRMKTSLADADFRFGAWRARPLLESARYKLRDGRLPTLQFQAELTYPELSANAEKTERQGIRWVGTGFRVQLEMLHRESILEAEDGEPAAFLLSASPMVSFGQQAENVLRPLLASVRPAESKRRLPLITHGLVIQAVRVADQFRFVASPDVDDVLEPESHEIGMRWVLKVIPDAPLVLRGYLSIVDGGWSIRGEIEGEETRIFRGVNELEASLRPVVLAQVKQLFADTQRMDDLLRAVDEPLRSLILQPGVKQTVDPDQMQVTLSLGDDPRAGVRFQLNAAGQLEPLEKTLAGEGIDRWIAALCVRRAGLEVSDESARAALDSLVGGSARIRRELKKGRRVSRVELRIRLRGGLEASGSSNKGFDLPWVKVEMNEAGVPRFEAAESRDPPSIRLAPGIEGQVTNQDWLTEGRLRLVTPFAGFLADVGTVDFDLATGSVNYRAPSSGLENESDLSRALPDLLRLALPEGLTISPDWKPRISDAKIIAPNAPDSGPLTLKFQAEIAGESVALAAGYQNGRLELENLDGLRTRLERSKDLWVEEMEQQSQGLVERLEAWQARTHTLVLTEGVTLEVGFPEPLETRTTNRIRTFDLSQGRVTLRLSRENAEEVEVGVRLRSVPVPCPESAGEELLDLLNRGGGGIGELGFSVEAPEKMMAIFAMPDWEGGPSIQLNELSYGSTEWKFGGALRITPESPSVPFDGTVNGESLLTGLMGAMIESVTREEKIHVLELGSGATLSVRLTDKSGAGRVALGLEFEFYSPHPSEILVRGTEALLSWNGEWNWQPPRISLPEGYLGTLRSMAERRLRTMVRGFGFERISDLPVRVEIGAEALSLARIDRPSFLGRVDLTTKAMGYLGLKGKPLGADFRLSPEGFSIEGAEAIRQAIEAKLAIEAKRVATRGLKQWLEDSLKHLDSRGIRSLATVSEALYRNPLEVGGEGAGLSIRVLDVTHFAWSGLKRHDDQRLEISFSSKENENEDELGLKFDLAVGLPGGYQLEISGSPPPRSAAEAATKQGAFYLDDRGLRARSDALISLRDPDGVLHELVPGELLGRFAGNASAKMSFLKSLPFDLSLVLEHALAAPSSGEPEPVLVYTGRQDSGAQTTEWKEIHLSRLGMRLEWQVRPEALGPLIKDLPFVSVNEDALPIEMAVARISKAGLEFTFDPQSGLDALIKWLTPDPPATIDLGLFRADQLGFEIREGELALSGRLAMAKPPSSPDSNAELNGALGDLLNLGLAFSNVRVGFNGLDLAQAEFAVDSSGSNPVAVLAERAERFLKTLLQQTLQLVPDAIELDGATELSPTEVSVGFKVRMSLLGDSMQVPIRFHVRHRDGRFSLEVEGADASGLRAITGFLGRTLVHHLDKEVKRMAPVELGAVSIRALGIRYDENDLALKLNLQLAIRDWLPSTQFELDYRGNLEADFDRIVREAGDAIAGPLSNAVKRGILRQLNGVNWPATVEQDLWKLLQLPDLGVTLAIAPQDPGTPISFSTPMVWQALLKPSNGRRDFVLPYQLNKERREVRIPLSAAGVPIIEVQFDVATLALDIRWTGNLLEPLKHALQEAGIDALCESLNVPDRFKLELLGNSFVVVPSYDKDQHEVVADLEAKRRGQSLVATDGHERERDVLRLRGIRLTGGLDKPRPSFDRVQVENAHVLAQWLTHVGGLEDFLTIERLEVEGGTVIVSGGLDIPEIGSGSFRNLKFPLEGTADELIVAALNIALAQIKTQEVELSDEQILYFEDFRVDLKPSLVVECNLRAQIIEDPVLIEVPGKLSLSANGVRLHFDDPKDIFVQVMGGLAATAIFDQFGEVMNELAGIKIDPPKVHWSPNNVPIGFTTGFRVSTGFLGDSLGKLELGCRGIRVTKDGLQPPDEWLLVLPGFLPISPIDIFEPEAVFNTADGNFSVGAKVTLSPFESNKHVLYFKSEITLPLKRLTRLEQSGTLVVLKVLPLGRTRGVLDLENKSVLQEFETLPLLKDIFYLRGQLGFYAKGPRFEGDLLARVLKLDVARGQIFADFGKGQIHIAGRVDLVIIYADAAFVVDKGWRNPTLKASAGRRLGPFELAHIGVDLDSRRVKTEASVLFVKAGLEFPHPHLIDEQLIIDSLLNLLNPLKWLESLASLLSGNTNISIGSPPGGGENSGGSASRDGGQSGASGGNGSQGGGGRQSGEGDGQEGIEGDAPPGAGDSPGGGEDPRTSPKDAPPGEKPFSPENGPVHQAVPAPKQPTQSAVPPPKPMPGGGSKSLPSNWGDIAVTEQFMPKSKTSGNFIYERKYLGSSGFRSDDWDELVALPFLNQAQVDQLMKWGSSDGTAPPWVSVGWNHLIVRVPDDSELGLYQGVYQFDCDYRYQRDEKDPRLYFKEFEVIHVPMPVEYLSRGDWKDSGYGLSQRGLAIQWVYSRVFRAVHGSEASAHYVRAGEPSEGRFSEKRPLRHGKFVVSDWLLDIVYDPEDGARPLALTINEEVFVDGRGVLEKFLDADSVSEYPFWVFNEHGSVFAPFGVGIRHLTEKARRELLNPLQIKQHPALYQRLGNSRITPLGKPEEDSGGKLRILGLAPSVRRFGWRKVETVPRRLSIFRETVPSTTKLEETAVSDYPLPPDLDDFLKEQEARGDGRKMNLAFEDVEGVGLIVSVAGDALKSLASDFEAAMADESNDGAIDFPFWVLPAKNPKGGARLYRMDRNAAIQWNASLLDVGFMKAQPHFLSRVIELAASGGKPLRPLSVSGIGTSGPWRASFLQAGKTEVDSARLVVVTTDAKQSRATLFEIGSDVTEHVAELTRTNPDEVSKLVHLVPLADPFETQRIVFGSKVAVVAALGSTTDSLPLWILENRPARSLRPFAPSFFQSTEVPLQDGFLDPSELIAVEKQSFIDQLTLISAERSLVPLWFLPDGPEETGWDLYLMRLDKRRLYRLWERGAVAESRAWDLPVEAFDHIREVANTTPLEMKGMFHPLASDPGEAAAGRLLLGLAAMAKSDLKDGEGDNVAEDWIRLWLLSPGRVENSVLYRRPFGKSGETMTRASADDGREVELVHPGALRLNPAFLLSGEQVRESFSGESAVRPLWFSQDDDSGDWEVYLLRETSASSIVRVWGQGSAFEVREYPAADELIAWMKGVAKTNPGAYENLFHPVQTDDDTPPQHLLIGSFSLLESAVNEAGDEARKELPLYILGEGVGEGLQPLAKPFTGVFQGGGDGHDLSFIDPAKVSQRPDIVRYLIDACIVGATLRPLWMECQVGGALSEGYFLRETDGESEIAVVRYWNEDDRMHRFLGLGPGARENDGLDRLYMALATEGASARFTFVSDSASEGDDPRRGWLMVRIEDSSAEDRLKSDSDFGVFPLWILVDDRPGLSPYDPHQLSRSGASATSPLRSLDSVSFDETLFNRSELAKRLALIRTLMLRGSEGRLIPLSFWRDEANSELWHVLFYQRSTGLLLYWYQNGVADRLADLESAICPESLATFLSRYDVPEDIARMRVADVQEERLSSPQAGVIWLQNPESSASSDVIPKSWPERFGELNDEGFYPLWVIPAGRTGPRSTMAVFSTHGYGTYRIDKMPEAVQYSEILGPDLVSRSALFDRLIDLGKQGDGKVHLSHFERTDKGAWFALLHTRPQSEPGATDQKWGLTVWNEARSEVGGPLQVRDVSAEVNLETFLHSLGLGQFNERLRPRFLNDLKQLTHDETLLCVGPRAIDQLPGLGADAVLLSDQQTRSGGVPGYVIGPRSGEASAGTDYKLRFVHHRDSVERPLALEARRDRGQRILARYEVELDSEILSESVALKEMRDGSVGGMWQFLTELMWETLRVAGRQRFERWSKAPHTLLDADAP